jgi:hypothetical protein
VRGSAALLAVISFAAFFGTPHSSSAIPAPEAEPQPHTKQSPSPAPTATVFGILPVGSDIYFILDDELSSAKSKPGTVVQAHLKDALVFGGVTLAPAGTPASIDILRTRHKGVQEQMGFVQILFEPLNLPDIGLLPIRAPHEYLTIDMTAGQVATQASADTVGDIFIPYYPLFQIFRPGHDFVLPKGAIFRAETAATIDARNRAAVVVATPPPIVTNFDPPHADFRPVPLYTAAPTPSPQPKPTRRPPTPSPEPTDSPSPRPTASPTPTPSPAPSPTGSPTPPT